MPQRSAPETAFVDRPQIHASIPHPRANYEATCLKFAWATAIVAFIMLALLAIL